MRSILNTLVFISLIALSYSGYTVEDAESLSLKAARMVHKVSHYTLSFGVGKTVRDIWLNRATQVELAEFGSPNYDENIHILLSSEQAIYLKQISGHGKSDESESFITEDENEEAIHNIAAKDPRFNSPGTLQHLKADSNQSPNAPWETLFNEEPTPHLKETLGKICKSLQQYYPGSIIISDPDSDSFKEFPFKTSYSVAKKMPAYFLEEFFEHRVHSSKPLENYKDCEIQKDANTKNITLEITGDNQAKSYQVTSTPIRHFTSKKDYWTSHIIGGASGILTHFGLNFFERKAQGSVRAYGVVSLLGAIFSAMSYNNRIHKALWMTLPLLTYGLSGAYVQKYEKKAG